MADEPGRENNPGARSAPQRCWIYKSTRRSETYLYLAEENGFDAAPKALLEQMGVLELVMELELHPGTKLARAKVAEVMRSLKRKGYYLQLPPVHIPGRHGLQ